AHVHFSYWNKFGVRDAAFDLRPIMWVGNARHTSITADASILPGHSAQLPPISERVADLKSQPALAPAHSCARVSFFRVLVKSCGYFCGLEVGKSCAWCRDCAFQLGLEFVNPYAWHGDLHESDGCGTRSLNNLAERYERQEGHADAEPL